MGPRAVIIRAGTGPETRWWMCCSMARISAEYRNTRVKTDSTHGTGCTFASAIAAHLALGENLPDAVGLARDYLQGALEHAQPIGRPRAVNHFWRLLG
jgi:hydroxymethylpyrimidine/phosphomethylpyrimidine kinase